MTINKIHPALAIPLLIIASPLLAALIGLFWVLTTLGSVLFAALLWPFQVLAGVALSVLGGGR